MSETRTDPTEFLGDPGRKKVRAGPVRSGRARVVEFSYNRLEPGNNRAVRSVPVQAEPSAAARRSVMVVVDVGCDDETPGWT